MSNFTIKLEKWYAGFSPTAHLNSLTEIGNAGMASSMTNADILTPGILTQGPGLATLTAGTEAGAVTELINHILDVAVAADTTYGIGTTKLFKISSTAVTNAGAWPHAITNCTDGESVLNMGGNLYYLYNTSTAGDIGKFDLSSTFDDDWGSTIPTGAAALQKADHPSATKEDIITFGNGQYLGVYIGSSNTLYPTKLDFKTGNSVADVIFHANKWFIALNGGVTGINRNYSQIFSYDGGALTTLLSDEVAVGVQKIGFLYPLNGVVYVAYQDLSFSGGYKIGYLTGRKIEPLVHFTGSLPNFAQRTLYKNTILFLSSGLVYSAGAVVGELPFSISQHADGGYATCGAIAAPFGTPMIASTQSTSYKLAKFSGFDTNCNWKSVVIPLINGRMKGYIDRVTVLTGTLAANARCDLVLEYNQNSSNSGTAKQITGTGLRKFDFNIGSGAIEDLRAYLNWANGNATNDCPIRQILIQGHWTER